MAKINSAIGIDYDSHEIRAVELTKNPDGSLFVSAYGKKTLGESVITGGMVTDQAMFTSALNDLIADGKFKVSPVVVGVNNENVIMRYATFPKVPEDKLRSVITMQAQDFIPVPISELELDFVVIDETADDDDQPALNVLLVGARNLMVDNLLHALQNSKLEVTEVDSSFLAWCRAILDKAADDDVFGIFKLTDDVLNFVAVNSKEIKMVRSINIPDSASVEVKRAFNKSDEITQTELETIADLLNSELSSSINYFQMQTGAIISSVLFSAETSLEGDILARINEKSFVPLQKPTLCDEFDDGQFEPTAYAAAISLAKVALEG